MRTTNNNLDKQERIDRLEQFEADVLDEIILQEQNINPHDCDHTPNHLMPIRIEFNPVQNKNIVINKCMCCNAEVPEDYDNGKDMDMEMQYMDESMMN